MRPSPFPAAAPWRREVWVCRSWAAQGSATGSARPVRRRQVRGRERAVAAAPQLSPVSLAGPVGFRPGPSGRAAALCSSPVAVFGPTACGVGQLGERPVCRLRLPEPRALRVPWPPGAGGWCSLSSWWPAGWWARPRPAAGALSLAGGWYPRPAAQMALPDTPSTAPPHPPRPRPRPADTETWGGESGARGGHGKFAPCVPGALTKAS